MKYYFILTDEKDAWMQFVYLPTGDYVSGYIRDLRSVGISVHDYDLWTEETDITRDRDPFIIGKDFYFTFRFLRIGQSTIAREKENRTKPQSQR